ncbi:DNA-3-methyladenine glycosylase family protein [Chitiniphilus eburneus]|uniref:DNA-3-methyladenine glycosylase II n=1 Tax=Chitiniphilus eburneus TaxID=2571148 RepID=A0A4U0QB10_9NEIS|nr:DNA-3-methyladenine glycosylase [Chitiniphilus eburneus]TJZ73014.1 DNA-3-methyladenine glycosylase 2 family protein [Chitiniphilus eburneus]
MTDDRYLAASRHLAALDADWARLIDQVGPCRHQPKPAREPYEALIRAVAYQQLHARAGDAILARLLGLFAGPTFPDPPQLLALPDDALRGCGFSARKRVTIQAIAAGVLDGRVPTRSEAEALDDATLIARLSALPGIGRWTVEMLLIYTLERQDVCPADDFGVREGYRWLKSLPSLPPPGALRLASRAWAPYRTVAAWYLWRVPALPGYRKV